MCSIAAVTTKGSPSDTSSTLCAILENMTYRGYDSIGLSASDGHTLRTRKALGTDFDQIHLGGLFKAAIGQTRWATHGQNTLANANPQVALDGRQPAVAAVMNGIISNYASAKAQLSGVFASENDTEAVSHAAVNKKFDMQSVANLLEGRYACITMSNTGLMGFIRQGPSLVTGMLDSIQCIASDIHALAAVGITRVAVIPSGTFGYMSATGISAFEITSGNLVRLDYQDIPPAESMPLQSKGITESELKEAYSMATAGLGHLSPAPQSNIQAAARALANITLSSKVLFTGSGSSYHMALLGAHLLPGALAKPACEVIHDMPDVSVVIAISQSGESGDILQAVESVRHRSDAVISISNNSLSSLASLSDICIEMGCGPERGVAATKSVIVTAMILYGLLTPRCGDGWQQKAEIAVCDLTEASVLLNSGTDAYILGSGIWQVPAMEAALKLKELAYMHAEACFAGEFKHGPLAVLDEGDVILLIDPDLRHADMSAEIRARGGRTILLTHEGTDAYESDIVLRLPSKGTDDARLLQCILTVQSLAINVAKRAGKPVDRPRNLAKCVTV